MRALAFSDLHLDREAADAILDAAPEADIVFGVGDFAQSRRALDAFMAHLAPISAKAVYVPGNNETEAELRAATDALVLHGETAERDGLRIAGLGGAVPPLPEMGWDSFDISETDAAALMSDWQDADVVLTHSPPRDLADLHRKMGRLGSYAVREAIERLQPRLALCGHVHDCWGEEGMIGDCRVVNLGPTLNWFDL